MSVIQRIKLVKRHKRFTNCFGTALYIAGIIGKDRIISYPWDYEERIKKLDELAEPEIYSLVIFRREDSEYPDHMAIVTGINPTLLTHRDGIRGPFIDKEPFEKVVERYGTNEMVEKHGPITRIEYRRIPNNP